MGYSFTWILNHLRASGSVESASYAATASYVNLTAGPNITINYVPGTIEISGSDAPGYLIWTRSFGINNAVLKDIPQHISYASGSSSIAYGYRTSASADFSQAQGYYTHASGSGSHAEGYYATASGMYSHAEGAYTFTIGDYSHAEGYGTIALPVIAGYLGFDSTYISDEARRLDSRYGDISALFVPGSAYVYYDGGVQFAAIITGVNYDGTYTYVSASSPTPNGPLVLGTYYAASGDVPTDSKGSHAEGLGTRAIGGASHAEGSNNAAFGFVSHTEGDGTYTIGVASHAEGYNTLAIGNASHTEGTSTITKGEHAHAEGNATKTYGAAAHAEGIETIAVGNNSHTEGYRSTTGYVSSFVDDFPVPAGNNLFFLVLSSETVDSTAYFPVGGTVIILDDAFGYLGECEVYDNEFAGTTNLTLIGYSGYVGYVLSGDTSVAVHSHAEGSRTNASAEDSHAEGSLTKATGPYSHAEGIGTRATDNGAHSEGYYTIASGQQAHAEGYLTIASGSYSHAEGKLTTAFGEASHAQGSESIALGVASHAGGLYTIASASFQTVFGRYNKQGNTQDFFVIGDGTEDYFESRSNALGVGLYGSEYLFYASNSVYFPDLTKVYQPNLVVFDSASKRIYYESASAYQSLPGGPNGSIQFNSASTFSGSGNLTYNFNTSTIYLTGSQTIQLSGSSAALQIKNICDGVVSTLTNLPFVDTLLYGSAYRMRSIWIPSGSYGQLWNLASIGPAYVFDVTNSDGDLQFRTALGKPGMGIGAPAGAAYLGPTAIYAANLDKLLIVQSNFYGDRQNSTRVFAYSASFLTAQPLGSTSSYSDAVTSTIYSYTSSLVGADGAGCTGNSVLGVGGQGTSPSGYDIIAYTPSGSGPTTHFYSVGGFMSSSKGSANYTTLPPGTPLSASITAGDSREVQGLYVPVGFYMSTFEQTNPTTMSVDFSTQLTNAPFNIPPERLIGTSLYGADVFAILYNPIIDRIYCFVNLPGAEIPAGGAGPNTILICELDNTTSPPTLTNVTDSANGTIAVYNYFTCKGIQINTTNQDILFVNDIGGSPYQTRFTFYDATTTDLDFYPANKKVEYTIPFYSRRGSILAVSNSFYMVGSTANFGPNQTNDLVLLKIESGSSGYTFTSNSYADTYNIGNNANYISTSQPTFASGSVNKIFTYNTSDVGPIGDPFNQTNPETPLAPARNRYTYALNTSSLSLSATFSPYTIEVGRIGNFVEFIGCDGDILSYVDANGQFVGTASYALSVLPGAPIASPGSNTEVIYNSAGTLDGSPNFTFNYNTNQLVISNGAISASYGANTVGFYGTASWAQTASYALNAGGNVSFFSSSTSLTSNLSSLVITGSGVTATVNGTQVTMSFTGGGGGGGTANPGGSNTHIQFNYNGTDLSGSANFSFISQSNTVFLTGSMVISGSAPTASLNIIGISLVTGSSVVSGSLTTIGTSTVTGSLIVSNSLNTIGTSVVTGSNIISGSSQLIGTGTVTGSLIVSNSLNVIGTSQVTGSLIVSNSFNLIGTGGVTGSLIVSSSLTTIGTNIITGSLLISGSTVQTGSMFVSGAISASFGPNTVGFVGTSSWAVSASWAPIGPGTWNTLAKFDSTGVDVENTTIAYVPNGIAPGNDNIYYVQDNGLLIGDLNSSKLSEFSGSNIYVNNIHPASQFITASAGETVTVKFVDLMGLNAPRPTLYCYGIIIDYNIIYGDSANFGLPDKHKYSDDIVFPGSLMPYSETGNIQFTWNGGNSLDYTSPKNYLCNGNPISPDFVSFGATVGPWGFGANSEPLDATVIFTRAPRNTFYHDEARGHQFGYRVVNDLSSTWFAEIVLHCDNNNSDGPVNMTYTTKLLTYKIVS